VFVVNTSGCADDPAMLILLVKGTDLSNLSPKLYKSSMMWLLLQAIKEPME
jgi:hypothetical protein